MCTVGAGKRVLGVTDSTNALGARRRDVSPTWCVAACDMQGWEPAPLIAAWKERAVDVFDEDAEPFDLKDDADVEEDDDYEDDLEEATEDDVDLLVAAFADALAEA